MKDVFWVKDEAGNNLALIVQSTHKVDGVEFLTPETFGQQLALMKRPTGHIIDAHVHMPVSRDLIGTQEVIILQSGSMRVDLFDDSKKYVESVILNSGDIALLCSGGHGFEVIEEATFIEVKQGPFTPELDKVRFAPHYGDGIVLRNKHLDSHE